MKYCADCGYYVPGGVEENCLVRVGSRKSATCPLREACESFVDKSEMEPETEFPKLVLRKPKKRKK